MHRIHGADSSSIVPSQATDGPHGDVAFHLSRQVLDERFGALPAAPKEQGRIALLVSRHENEVRETPQVVQLTRAGGMPGDAWKRNTPDLGDAQLAVMRHDVAELIANGQDLTLFGDNLFIDLDLSTENLPSGTRLRAGSATLEVTPEPHNGCAKFRGRFGGDALRLTSDRHLRNLHLRGIYLRVVEDGDVAVGDPITVELRP